MTVLVDRLTDGTFIVWGTSDLAEATNAVMDPNEEWWEYLPAVDEEFDYDVEPVFEVTMTGPLRKNPCHPSMCDEGHGYHVGYARAPGHGARAGFILDFAGWQPQEFAIDEDVL